MTPRYRRISREDNDITLRMATKSSMYADILSGLGEGVS